MALLVVDSENDQHLICADHGHLLSHAKCLLLARELTAMSVLLFDPLAEVQSDGPKW
jgi:hypothetical protein